MATGTFYLRPSADTSVGHTLYPTDSTAAYLLINEETADDASTYISLAFSGTSGSATSVFALSGDIPSEKIKVTSIKLVHKSMTSNTSNVSCEVDFYISTDNATCSVSSTLSNSSYSTHEINITDTAFINAINNSVSFPDLTLSITTTGSSTSGSSKSANINTSQVYLEVTYEEVTDIGVHKKINGTWVAATQAYRKIDGAWTEITADECKEILQGSLCTGGE